jgi:hypothetical protein
MKRLAAEVARLERRLATEQQVILVWISGQPKPLAIGGSAAARRQAIKKATARST